MRLRILCLLATFISAFQVDGQPNILFLVADDMRPNLGVYQDINSPIFSSPRMYTPNLDALASSSMLFERAYAQQALCSPSRTSLLTSRRPDTTRILRIGNYWREIGGNFTTIPQFFKESGYFVTGGGKIFHGGHSSGHHDPISWSKPFSNLHNDPDDHSHSWKSFTEEELAVAPLCDTRETKIMINRLRHAAKNESYQPFFLGLGVHKPHLPFYFPERFLDYYPEEDIDLPYNPHVPVDMPDAAWHSPTIMSYEDCFPENVGVPEFGEINVTLPDGKVRELRRAYYAALSYADSELGRILDELVDLGLYENTIVVFWGDHGWQLGEHAGWGKLTNFEIATRVPFMIRVPGVTDGGIRMSKMVELVDLFPTLVDLAGLEPIPTCPEDSNNINLCTEGSSMADLIRNPETATWKSAVFWQFPRNWKDWVNDDIPQWMGYSIYTDDFHYTEWVNLTRLEGYDYEPNWDQQMDIPELYLVKDDIQENVNRYNDPEYYFVILELSEALHRGWMDALPASD